MKRVYSIILFLLLTGSLFCQPIVNISSTYHAQVAAGGSKAQYTDDFEAYTEGSLIGQGNWITGLNDYETGDFEGNMVISPSTATSVCAVIYNQPFANDQYAQISIAMPSTTRANGIGVRMTGSGATFCGYGFYVMSGTQRLFRVDNGTKTNLGNTGTETIAENDVFRLEISGTTLTAYKNGSVFTAVGTNGQATVTEYTSGKAGIIGYGDVSDALADNWEGGDL